MQVQSIHYGQTLFTGKHDSHIRKSDVMPKSTNTLSLKEALAKAELDEPMTDSSKRLVKKVSDLIEDTWTAIKKGKIKAEAPEFMVSPQRGEVASVKPVYNGIYKKMLIEVQNGDDIDRMIINRERPSEFMYEKSVVTKYGTATTKVFDSKIARDSAVEKRVNRLVSSVLSAVWKKYHL